MKHAHTWQRMTNNDNNNKRKQVWYLQQSRSAFLHNNRYYEIQISINVNSIKLVLSSANLCTGLLLKQAQM